MQSQTSSLLDAGLLGSTEPQILHLPPDVASHARATAAIELADAYGVADGHPLDDSQRFTLRSALGERADGSWSAAIVADIEPRQSGKNDSVAARELAGLILFGERLIIHTAHEFPTANESFLRLVAVFENWDDLRRKVARIRYANGEQGVELLSGAKLKYRARTGGSGRGFAQADLVVYDECQHLRSEHIAATSPTKLVARNAQAWYLGSGGLSTSVNAWDFRMQALRGDAGRLCYVEHTAEVVSLDEFGRVVSLRPDVNDRRTWAIAHPALGRRVTVERMEDVRRELGDELFARECLNVWDPLPGAAGETVISLDAWRACADTSSPWVDPVVLGVDSSPDREWSSIAFAANREDGRRHVELVKHAPGVAWLASDLIANRAEWGDPLVVVDTSSPAASVLAELESAGVRVVKVSSPKLAASCGAFYDAVSDRSLAHPDDPMFGAALVSAARRQVGDQWAWDRKDSGVDITPLVAATLALGELPRADDDAHDGSFLDLDDY